MAALTFLQTNTDATDLSTYDFVGENVGAAGATRGTIVAFALGFSGSSTVDVTSVTIGGNAATVKFAKVESTTSRIVGFAAVALPTGTTATISIVVNRTATRCSIAVYHVDDMSVFTVSDFVSSSAADAVGAVDCPPNGFIIGVATTGNNTSATWTNLTEDSDVAHGSTVLVTTASGTFVTEERARSITCNYATSSGGEPLALFCSWGFSTSYIRYDYFSPTGAGANSEWTSSPGGPAGWDCVNDAIGAADDDTTYVSSSTVNATDTYVFGTPAVPVGATVFAVYLYRRHRAVSGSWTQAPMLRCGGTDYQLTNFSLSSTAYADSVTKHQTNPRTTVLWTVDDLNGIGANALQEFGFLTGGGNEARITQVYIAVRYTPAGVMLTDTVKISDTLSVTRGGDLSAAPAADGVKLLDTVTAIRDRLTVPVFQSLYRHRRM